MTDTFLGTGLFWLVMSLLAVRTWGKPKKEPGVRQAAGERALGDLWAAATLCGLAAALRFWPW